MSTESLDLSKLIKVYRTEFVSHKTVQSLTKGARGSIPAHLVIIYGSEFERTRINCYRKMTIQKQFESGISFNDKLFISAKLLNMAEELGSSIHLVDNDGAKRLQSRLQAMLIERIAHISESVQKAPEVKVATEQTRPFQHSSKPLYVESRNDQLLAADVKQVGRVVTREVETRVDQSDFKRRVTLNYGGKCAITGHEVAQTLQAAHITAFASDRNNNTSNGILLDASLHILFDAGLMAINPENMCVYFNCQHPLAQQYGGKPIAVPRVALDVEALTIRWNRFK